MSASSKTVGHVAKILVEEIVLDKSRDVAERLRIGTKGNQSYTTTLNALSACLKDWK